MFATFKMFSFCQGDVCQKTFTFEGMEPEFISLLRVTCTSKSIHRIVLEIPSQYLSPFLHLDSFQTSFMSCLQGGSWRKCRTWWTDGYRWTEGSSSPCTGCGSSASIRRPPEKKIYGGFWFKEETIKGIFSFIHLKDGLLFCYCPAGATRLMMYFWCMKWLKRGPLPCIKMFRLVSLF